MACGVSFQETRPPERSCAVDGALRGGSEPADEGHCKELARSGELDVDDRG